MGRQERQLDPDAGEVQRFAAQLRELRREAGGMTYRAMAERTPYTVSTLSRAAGGERLPSLPVTLAYVAACGGDPQEWEARWRLVSDVVAVQADDAAEATAPYPGLARFEPTDRKRFFGRDELVDDLLRMVRDARFSVLFGPSGSGKSSLLRAGLIPALRNGRAQLPAPDGIRICTPGEHPMGVSAGVLAPREGDGDGDTLVVVDQFEEVFTLCRDPGERSRFVDRVLAAREPDSRLRVVVAVRADFYGRCAEHPALARALNEASLLVGPMEPDQLREAIVKPAQAEGLIVERALTARVISEVADEPGGLPLMSHALLETWRRRKGRSLSLAGYESAGGVRGAVAHTAEEAWGQLTEEQGDLARRILLRLVTPGEGAPDTRRPIDRRELAFADPAEIDAVLEHLARARLLTLDGTGIDLAHEALITAWPRFARWIDAERERLRVHRRLTDDAGSWQDLRRDPGALYRGSRLAGAEDLFPAERRGELTDLERVFLTASLHAREQEHQAAARTTRRLRALAIGLAVLLVTALSTTVIAVNQQQASVREQQRAVAAQDTARSRQLAAESRALLGSNPDLASLLAVEAYRLDPTAEARSSLHAAATVPLKYRLTTPGPVRTLALSPEANLLAAGTAEGTIRLWDADTGEPRMTLNPARSATDYPRGPVQEIVFSPDGSLLASHSDVAGGIVQLWDVATGDFRLLDDASWVSSLAFSPDGSLLATGDVGGDVRMWDVATGERRGDEIPGGSSGVVSLAFSPDGVTLATGDMRGDVRLLDAHTGTLRRILTDHTESLTSLAFNRDGSLLATGSEDGTARVWEPTAGEPRYTFIVTPREAAVRAVTFGADDVLATGSEDGPVRLWDTDTGMMRIALNGHQHSITSLAFGAGSATLASGDSAGTIRLWDTEAGTPRYRLADDGAEVTSLQFSPDGSLLASAGGDGTARQWHTASGEPRAETATGPVTTTVLSPDGTMLATGATDGTVRLWDVAAGTRIRELPARAGWVASLAFSPDGETLAVGYDGGTLRLWDVATGETRETLATGWVTAMAFSPDGAVLATGGVEGRTRLWNTVTGGLRTTLVGTGWTTSLSVDPDGTTLASAGQDGLVRLWDIATGQRLGDIKDARHTLVTVAFSPDRTTLAVGSEDGTVQVWDTATLEKRSTIMGHRTAVEALAFSPDGATLATGDRQGRVRYWEEDVFTPTEAIDQVCQAVNRDLTEEERLLYLPDDRVRPVC
ncbi:helix-turn-helix domain-containing protein [Streptomyces sp. B6B3]|uniref:nSTAND1 domain-containing NTPase n=1 Tax=Streptomyces sp. B6B3 TaxID=3153570 RepID=UPI00325D8ACD